MSVEQEQILCAKQTHALLLGAAEEENRRRLTRKQLKQGEN